MALDSPEGQVRAVASVAKFMTDASYYPPHETAQLLRDADHVAARKVKTCRAGHVF